MEQLEQQNLLAHRLAEEEAIREKIDENGKRWMKVYFGGRPYSGSWLSQFVELQGAENVQVEEIDLRGFQCFEESVQQYIFF